MKELITNTYYFAECELDLTRRLLLRGGQSVQLNAKAFELLVVLIENRERVIAKEELMELVWRDQFVEEANLAVQISQLRKALGEKKSEHRFIVTVPGRGYRFVADVQNAKRDVVPDIVIETHTTSHVVVEEDILTECTESLVASDWTSEPVIGETESGLTTYNLDQRSSRASLIDTPSNQSMARSSDQVRQRRRHQIVWIASMLGVLFLSALGLWIYQLRKQNGPASASLPAKEISMRRFTTLGGVPYRAVISPDGKSLVYVQRIKGRDSLWLGQIETNNSVQITEPFNSWYGYPVFAPDGDSIYFTLQDDSHPQWTLLRMSVVGGALTELIRNVHSPVTFSPDGRQLAFLRKDDETNQISIVIADAADGNRERILISRRDPVGFATDGLSWSPDGKTIAVAAAKTESKRKELLAVSVADGSINKIGEHDWDYVGNLVWLPDASGLVTIAAENFTHRGGGEIWLVTYPEGATRRVTNDVTNYQTGNLSVSADGRLAVLSAHRNPEIWVAPNADISQSRRVLQGANLRDEGSHGLTSTPDGRWLYTAYVGESQTIWSMKTDGSNKQQLTAPVNDSSFDNQMSVPTNGRYLVFHSNRSGDSEIWRANIDGSDLHQLTTGGSNSQPSFSPDGHWVVYTSVRDRKQTLWRISSDGGEATQITGRVLSWPEVSPDGKLIACIDPTTSPRWRLLVIPFAGGDPVKSFAVPESAFLARRVRWTPDGKAIMYLDAQEQGLWRQMLDEEKPQLLKGFQDVPIFHFTWSLDGKDLIYTTGKVTREIILIENFK